MPSALAMTRSSGVVMKPRTRSALAPTYTVVTCTTAMSLRGYCRTESVRIAWMPAIRITRLTTIARTGRLMKRSVNFMAFRSLPSAVHGVRRRVVAGLRLVVDLDGRPVSELEDTRGHDLLAGLQAREDRDLVAAAGPDLDELLAHALVGLAAVLVLDLRHDEHGVAVRSVVDRGRRDRDDVARAAEVHARL